MIRGIRKGNHPGQAEGVCDICGAVSEPEVCKYTGRHGHSLKPNEAQVIQKLRAKGWSMIGGKLRCPADEAKRKAASQAKETLPEETLDITFAPLAKPVPISLTDLQRGSIPEDPSIPSRWEKIPDADTSPTRIKMTAREAAREERRALIRQHSAAGITDIRTMAALVKADRTTVGDDMNAMGLPVTKRAHGRYPTKPNQTIASNPIATTEPTMSKNDTTQAEVIPPKPGASTEPPRQPTVAQRRAIRDMLDLVYDEPNQRYTAGETDFTVAAALEGGVMPGWVAEVREAFYGPAGNAELDKMVADLDALTAKVAADARELRALAADLDRVQKASAATATAVAEMRQQIIRMKAALGPKGARL